MYLTEISPVSIRGAMGVLCPLGITVGVLVAQILGLKSVLGNSLIILFVVKLFSYILSIFRIHLTTERWSLTKFPVKLQ